MIRDLIEPFEITDEQLAKHPNEVGPLRYLYSGLEYLYEMVKRAEREYWDRIIRETKPQDAGDPVLQESVHPGVRICAFHWYATTACNFVKTIGWFREREHPGAPTVEAYVKAVLPEVKLWRDKVSAHFAFHTPRSKDTPADVFASIIPPTAFHNGRFVAGAYQATITRKGQTSTSQLLPWSLTEVQEKLRARYGIPTV